MVKHECLMDDILCYDCQELGCLRCHQCGDNMILCVTCERNWHHNKPFHDQQGWLGNHLQPTQPLQSINETGQMLDVGVCLGA